MMEERTLKETEIGTIPEDWDVTSIEDIASREKYSLSMGPFGSNITTDNFVPQGVPVIRGNNLTSYRFVDSGFVFVSEEKADELASSNVKPGDIVVTHRGTLGQVGIIPEKPKYPRYVVSQSGMKLTCDRHQVDPNFVFYWLKSPRGQRELLKNTSQTGVPAIAQPLSSFRKIRVPRPNIREQHAIAKILSDIDSKIELNQQMNKTLEAIGKITFKRWFIDLDFPVKENKPYKSSGGKMVYDEHLEKDIPKGWKVDRLRNLVKSIESGRRPKGGIDQTLKDGIPSIGAENINGLGFYDYSSTKYIPQEFFEQMEQGVVRDYDVLLYKDGAQLGRKTIFGKGFPFTKCCVNEHVFILRTSEELNQLFLYFWLDQNEVTERIRNLNANSAQPGINKESLGSLEILVPEMNVLDRFERALGRFIDKIFLNCLESRNLSQIRDILLPRLILGKVRVPIEVR